MVFSSPRFLAFLATLLLVLSLPQAPKTRKRLLLIASTFFYAAWDVRYLALLAAVSIIDYLVANRIDASDDQRTRKAWLVVSITSNLGILAYFKYYNFFLDNLNGIFGALLGLHLRHANILLPAGISFYTFKTMSYTIDVYRRELKPEKHLLDYATFVTFFPELIAGPIVRASIFLPQMSRDIRPSVARLALGGSIFVVGLTKKLLIADSLAKVADPIFAQPELYSGLSVWTGVLAYSFQIYADFAGYSDMAIGVAKMLGYDLPENFSLPYLSRTVTEFWRRWHITLSSWLRDYLYIPLGGNRGAPGRTYINLMATMILGGLWHGASWNFVLWGTLHGAALATHRLIRSRWPTRYIVPSGISVVGTFLFVTIAWVPFRSDSFGKTRLILSRLANFDSAGANWFSSILIPVAVLLVAGHVVGRALEVRVKRQTPNWVDRVLAAFDAHLLRDPVSGVYVRLGIRTATGAFLCTIWVLAIWLFAPLNTSPFIYFQF